MRKRRERPHRCPICSNEHAFTALVARIKAMPFRQTSAGSWKTVATEAARYDGRAVLAFVCENCSHPTTPPVSVISNILNDVTRKTRNRRGGGSRP